MEHWKPQSAHSGPVAQWDGCSSAADSGPAAAEQRAFAEARIHAGFAGMIVHDECSCGGAAASSVFEP